MGCYVNPENETKEEFLEREGREVITDFVSSNYKFLKQEGKLPVVLCDNGSFTAAGVAYTEREFECFVRYDNRPKRIFIVPIEKLKEVSDVEGWLAESKEEEWRTRYN